MSVEITPTLIVQVVISYPSQRTLYTQITLVDNFSHPEQNILFRLVRDRGGSSYGMYYADIIWTGQLSRSDRTGRYWE